MPDLYLVLSPDLHILTASDAYLSTTLTQRQEIVGKSVFEVFPDNPNAPLANSVASLRASLQEVLSTKKPHQMTPLRYDLPRTDLAGGGFEERYWNSINIPVLNNEGQVLYILHKTTDVTEQVTNQKKLQELTVREQKAGWEWKKLQSVFMQAPVAIGIYSGKEHVVELVNPAMCTLLGHQQEALLNKPLLEAVPEIKQQRFDEILATVYTTGIHFTAKEWKGTLFRQGAWTSGFYHLDCQPLYGTNQQIIGVIQIINDVSAEVETRQRIVQSERQLRLITDALPVLISYLDTELKYQFANKAYEKWFPMKAREVLGRPIWEVIGENAYQGVKKYMQQALAGERVEFEARMPYREDFIKYIHTVYVPDIQEGQVAGFFALVTDVSEQVVARQKLEESKEKYRSLFETMDQGFCVLEMLFDSSNTPVDYRFLEINPMFEQQTGLRNAVGKTARQLVPNLEEKWFKVYGKVATTGQPVNFIEGSEAMGRWFEVFAYRLGGNESHKVALLFTDISERKRTEENLRKSNSWFELVNRATQDAIWDWDLQNQQITWNDGVHSMFNYSADEIVSNANWRYEHIHPEDRERVVGGIHAIIDSGKEHWTDEYRFLTGDGSHKIVLDRGFVLHDKNGAPYRMIGSMQDITERKRAEEALKLSEEHFKTFANNIQNLAWMAEPSGWIYWYNQRWYDYTGTTLEEMQGWGWEKVHHPDHIKRVLDFVKEAWQKGETWEMTFPLRAADGAFHWFITRAYAVKDANGAVIRWIGTNTNIDEQKQAEASLAEKNRQLIHINNDLDNFIYTASHDLRAPILNIEGLMNVINKSFSEELKQEAKIQKLMSMVYQSIDKFKDTIKDLTEVAKIQNNGEEDLSELSFASMLDEVKLSVKDLIDETNAHIEEDFSPAPLIYFSKKNLRSLLYNLVSNAIKYHSPDRPAMVRVTTSQPDPAHILLSVQDNGLGIKEKDQAKVFKMFTRLHLHVEGTGVGMSIVKKIVDNNGGRIEIESEEGKGTLFKIYLKAEPIR